MNKLDEIAMLLYNKPYNDLEPHQQYDVQQTANNPDYQLKGLLIYNCLCFITMYIYIYIYIIYNI